MKTTTAFILTAAMALSFTGCDLMTKPCYTSTSDVTLEKIIENSAPSKMVEYKGGFKQTYDYSGSGKENMDDGEFYRSYKKSGSLLEANIGSKYPDEYFSNVYISTDKDDPYLYSKNPMGITKNELTQGEIDQLFNGTVLGYVNFDPSLEDVTEKDGNYIATLKISQGEVDIGTDTLTIDPKSGMILKVKSTQQDEETGKELVVISEFTYTRDIEIDTTPKTEYRDPVEAEEVPADSAAEAAETAAAN